MEELGLLSPVYDPEEFFVQSTNVNRTIESAKAQLLGIYGPYDANGN